MATKQIITCDGCEREETAPQPKWMKVNAPAGFLTGDMKDRAPTQADLCPTCMHKAAMVFSAYRRFTGAVEEAQPHAPASATEDRSVKPASSGRSAHGSRYAAVLTLLRSGAKTQPMLIDAMRNHGYSAAMVSHISEIVARLMKRDMVRQKEKDGATWYYARPDAMSLAEKAKLLGPKLRKVRRASSAASHHVAKPTTGGTLGARIIELLKTGPATTGELVKVLGAKDRRPVNGALQFLRKHGRVESLVLDGGFEAWTLAVG